MTENGDPPKSSPPALRLVAAPPSMHNCSMSDREPVGREDASRATDPTVPDEHLTAYEYAQRRYARMADDPARAETARSSEEVWALYEQFPSAEWEQVSQHAYRDSDGVLRTRHRSVREAGSDPPPPPVDLGSPPPSSSRPTRGRRPAPGPPPDEPSTS